MPSNYSFMILRRTASSIKNKRNPLKIKDFLIDFDHNFDHNNFILEQIQVFQVVSSLIP